MADAHEHDHADHADEFPRVETTELVAREIALRERRARWQPWLLALGVVLVALAFPTEALFGRTVGLVDATARGARITVELVPSALAVRLARLGLDAERAWFLLAAIAYGLTVVPLVRLARERGWEHGPALGVALLALSAPIAIVAGTSASASSAQLLGATLVLVEIASASSTSPKRALAFVVACSLHVANAWTWPALVAAELVSAPTGTGARASSRARRLVAPIAALVAFALVFACAHLAAGDLDRASRLALRVLFAGGSSGPGPILAWGTLWGPALGAAAVGIAALAVRFSRAEHLARELPLLLYLAVPWIAFALGGSLDFELPWLWLVPAGALGLLEALQAAEERRRGAFARLGALAMLGYGLLGAAWIRGLDRDAAWTARASELLNPGDVVLTASGEHLHLLAHRFHVRASDLRPMSAESREARERDLADLVELARALEAEGKRIVLDEDALTAFGTVAWPDAKELDRFVASARAVRLPPVPRGALASR